MDQIFGIGSYQNTNKLNKNWKVQNGCSPKQSPPKLKLFSLLSWTHETFKITRYIGKIKFDLIFGVPKWDVPLNEAAKIQDFLTRHVRHMKCSGLTIMKTR